MLKSIDHPKNATQCDNTPNGPCIETNDVEALDHGNDHLLFENKIVRLLTIKDLAAWLNVSEKTIYGWVYKGMIKPIKIGRLVRFDEKEIERWISREKEI